MNDTDSGCYERVRSCTNPEPCGGGADCVGVAVQRSKECPKGKTRKAKL